MQSAAVNLPAINAQTQCIHRNNLGPTCSIVMSGIAGIATWYRYLGIERGIDT